ncbi:MAG: 1-acyl-sn-glycerol-3-phosphate acyltransferase [Paracoccaceae bacterium]|nr:1-acyl-sn-glycerol-3-phosphate acyltransferase [Paracoccaceae bacterium]
MIRSTVFNLFFYAFTFAMALAAYAMARLGSRRALWRIVGFWGRNMLAAVRVILAARVEIRGLENQPEDGARLFVCKHQSELDIILLASAVPEFGAVAMQELERYPFFGPILRKLDLVLVPVEGARARRTGEVIEGARRIIAAGRPMVIFPEATLMSLGAKERYRRGAGRIYAALGVEAVPVASSLGVIWPRREWLKHPNRNAAIEVLAPIAPGLDVEAFTSEIENRIETATMRLIREHATGAVLAAAENRHATGAANED